ncbi:hypothetical protein J4573_40755 [Actinomadura barringtoniae]|uniref:Uncharacterized protein n=1 Tax=Actinomadura barringtoniae TaxID=1427535 RepID=A0A939PIX0_9ACTN|nr:hypothetical protein [Actinomadura barringtoniae]MBO2453480.1 hypothetical protein [Actinomadura barringtoniae]
MWRSGASSAAERIAPAASRSREIAGDRIMVARGWGAPRLEQASRYVESGLAPRVSSFLSGMADRVEPPKPRHRGRNAVLMLLAAVAAVGVAGAVATRRSNMQAMVDEVPAPEKEESPVKGEVDGHVRTP